MVIQVKDLLISENDVLSLFSLYFEHTCRVVLIRRFPLSRKSTSSFTSNWFWLTKNKLTLFLMGERWFSRRSENYPAPSLQLERKELDIYFLGLVSKAIHVLGIASKFFIDVSILSTNLTKSGLGYRQIWFYYKIWTVFGQRICRLLVWKLDSGSSEKKGIMWPQPGVFYWCQQHLHLLS